MKVTFRPLPAWPHPATPPDRRRSASTFRASYPDTLVLLEEEIWHLCPADVDAANVVFGVGLREQDVRLDGMPPRQRSGLPAPRAIALSLQARHGSVASALRATHPDTGGPTASARDFQAVIAFRDGGGS